MRRDHEPPNRTLEVDGERARDVRGAVAPV